MSAIAVVMMLMAMGVVWGGIAVSSIYLYKHRDK